MNDHKRLDCWFEALELFGAAPKSRRMFQPDKNFTLDYADKRAGDFSLTYKAKDNDDTEWLGFTALPYLGNWELNEEWSIHFWFKAAMESAPDSWRIEFIDADGSTAQGEFDYSGQKWKQLTYSLADLRKDRRFDVRNICACRVGAKLSAGDQLWFDDVYYFHSASGNEIGVSEKRVGQRIMEERATRGLRIREAFHKGAGIDTTGRYQQLFDRLWVGDNVEEINRELRSLWKQETENLDETSDIIWSSVVGETRLVSFYFCFSSKSDYMPGRLNSETEKALLELLWARSMYTNDIALTRHSTWWIGSSENHDINHKTFCLLTSRIFMNEPEYASRVYPDLGKGYGFKLNRNELATTRGNWSDGRPYLAGDHYRAWLSFFQEYFTERAKKGFFVERASEAYMKHTLSSVYAIYNFCMDDELRNKVRMFLDLVWTDWAMEQISGIRGGPKTRHHYRVGSRDSMTAFAVYHMGGPGLTEFNYAQMLLSDYELPPVVWELALDREGLGCFAYVSRGVGEEKPVCPRPPGTEHTMMGDVESRFVKYSWVTPDYILGTQMDHPHAVHSHLSVTGRWQGMICGSCPDARLVTVALNPSARQSPKGEKISLELMYNSVQFRQVLITQQRRTWMQIQPGHFPMYDDYYDREFGLYFGAEWDRMEETGGWIFAQKGNAYVAVKILLALTDSNPLSWAMGTNPYKGKVVLNADSYTWVEDRTIVRLNHKYSPVIIEAGRKADYPEMADFQQAILANRLELHPTVVTRETAFLIVYKGCGPDMKEIYFNAANTNDIPRIDGIAVDYRYSKAFDSPFIRSDYNSGVIKASKGQHMLNMEFDKMKSNQD